MFLMTSPVHESLVAPLQRVPSQPTLLAKSVLMLVLAVGLAAPKTTLLFTVHDALVKMVRFTCDVAPPVKLGAGRRDTWLSLLRLSIVPPRLITTAINSTKAKFLLDTSILLHPLFSIFLIKN